MQQTAEYIDRLELEKQQLQGTVQHLQRIVDSMGGGNNNNNSSECPQIIQQITSSPSTAVAIKKRKLDQAMTAISDSSDEGLGSMSPEPVTQMIFSSTSSGTTKVHHLATTTTASVQGAATTSVSTINVKDYVNLQNQMETERRHRMQLEEQLKQLEMQVYSTQNQPKYPQIHQEIIDEIDAGNHSGGEEKIILRPSEDGSIHYITNVVPHHSQSYVVVSTSTPGTSPKHILVNEDDDNSRTLSSDELNKEDEVKFVMRKTSPKHHHQVHLRIPSILEQAIKAEPKVEVERINSPICIMPTMIDNTNTSTQTNVRTTYPNNNHQRPNLETIVEAIRHLEGDAFDMDEETSTTTLTSGKISQQEAPLALTTSRQQQIQMQVPVKEPFKFRQSATSQATGLPQFVSVPFQQQQKPQQQQYQQQQQQRPGVIVVKQSS